jgi:hypothetical protein
MSRDSGLEVAQSSQHEQNVEVAQSMLPEHNKLDPQKELYPGVQPDDRPHLSSTPGTPYRSASRRSTGSLWLLVGVAVATAIIVGGALGGGLGSQLSKHAPYDRPLL